MAANALGEWARGLEYCRRVVEYGREVDDLRLKVVGLWRSGSTHIQRGAVAQGLQCCEDALALSPIAFDAVMTRATHGYGLDQAWRRRRGRRAARGRRGVVPAVEPPLHPCILRAVAGRGATCVSERHAEARALLEDVLATAREVGYRHVEGDGDSSARRKPSRRMTRGRPLGISRPRSLFSSASEPATRSPRRWRSRRRSGVPPAICRARARCSRARSISSRRWERSTRSSGCARAWTVSARPDSRDSRSRGRPPRCYQPVTNR